MGIKERRDRERQQVKNAILAAARSIAAAEGWQAVTIRKVADQIEYSPPTIYEHFASKEAILLDLMREGFLMLGAAIPASAVGDPASHVLNMARAYWSFAWENPELYQVMHGLGGVPFCFDDPLATSSGLQEAAESLFQITGQALRALPPLATADDALLDDMVHLIWGMLHGIVALTMSGRIKRGEEHGRRLAERAICDFLVARGVELPPA